MNKKIKVFLLIAFILALFLGGFQLYNNLTSDKLPGNTVAKSNEGQKSIAPDFTMLDMDGNEVKLSDFAGEPVIINFTASWCPNCKAEKADYQKAYNNFGDKVNFIILSMIDGNRETLDTAKEYIKENGYTFPSYYDINLEGAYAYAAYSVPMTVFIDKDGYVQTSYLGPITEAILKSYSETLFDLKL